MWTLNFTFYPFENISELTCKIDTNNNLLFQCRNAKGINTCTSFTNISTILHSNKTFFQRSRTGSKTLIVTLKM